MLSQVSSLMVEFHARLKQTYNKNQGGHTIIVVFAVVNQQKHNNTSRFLRFFLSLIMVIGIKCGSEMGHFCNNKRNVYLTRCFTIFL